MNATNALITPGTTPSEYLNILTLFPDLDYDIVSSLCNTENINVDYIHNKNTLKQTLLHHACHIGDVRVVKLLLDKGANVHARSVENRTVMHYALDNNIADNSDIICMLLNYGADIHAIDKYGDGVLYYAKTLNKSDKIVNLLTELGAKQ